jgi:short-subunit dehydrogenase
MKQQGRGHIINVSSASARRSLERMSCYGATKGAMHCFSQALRAEVAEDGIAVTEILPISVSTAFFDAAGYKPKGMVQTPDTIAALIARAMRTREAEICSSTLTRWGFVLDCMAPNLVARVMNLHRRWSLRRETRAP